MNVLLPIYTTQTSLYMHLELGTCCVIMFSELNYSDPVIRVVSNKRAFCIGTSRFLWPWWTNWSMAFATCIRCARPRWYPNMSALWKWAGSGRTSAHFHIWWINFRTKCDRKRGGTCVFSSDARSSRSVWFWNSLQAVFNAQKKPQTTLKSHSVLAGQR